MMSNKKMTDQEKGELILESLDKIRAIPGIKGCILTVAYDNGKYGGMLVGKFSPQSICESLFQTADNLSDIALKQKKNNGHN